MSNSISRTYTFSNGGTADGGQLDSEIQNIVNTINNADAGITAWTNVKTGILISTGATTLKGSSTNDSASAGNIGEQIVSSDSSGTVSATTSGNYADLLNISLTPGDWDISAILFVDKAPSVTDIRAGISSTSGNSATGLNTGDNYVLGLPPTSTIPNTLIIPSYRISLNAGTPYYLKYYTAYSSTAPKLSGRISARRMR